MNASFLNRMHSLDVPRTQPVLIKPQQSVHSSPLNDHLEHFVVDLFSEPKYRLLEWRGDKESRAHRRAENCRYPHLEFAEKDSKNTFAVGCHWIQHTENEAITWGKDEDFECYREFQKNRKMPVYVALGIAGKDAKPDSLYLIPLDVFQRKSKLTLANLLPYLCTPGTTELLQA